MNGLPGACGVHDLRELLNNIISEFPAQPHDSGDHAGGSPGGRHDLRVDEVVRYGGDLVTQRQLLADIPGEQLGRELSNEDERVGFERLHYIVMVPLPMLGSGHREVHKREGGLIKSRLRRGRRV